MITMPPPPPFEETGEVPRAGLCPGPPTTTGSGRDEDDVEDDDDDKATAFVEERWLLGIAVPLAAAAVAVGTGGTTRLNSCCRFWEMGGGVGGVEEHLGGGRGGASLNWEGQGDGEYWPVLARLLLVVAVSG